VSARGEEGGWPEGEKREKGRGEEANLCARERGGKKGQNPLVT
jgi:hypothetical protein